MDVRIKIDELRKLNGWSKARLAKEIGVSITAVNNWYNERKYMPTIKVLENVCTVFNMSMSELFADIDVDKLTPKQIKLLIYFDELSEIKQDAIIEITKNFNN